MLPDPAAQTFTVKVATIRVIAEKIRNLTPPGDISLVMHQVEELLDDSVSAEGYIICKTSASDEDEHKIDLSGIDFEVLANKFKTGRKRTINERLKGTVAQKLMKMVRLNRTRMDYLEKFQAIIEDYNVGSLNAEELFQQLVNFAQSLNEEEQRAVSEQLSEEELALFDLLTKPNITHTDAERKKVKTRARELLTTLKSEKLGLD